MRRRAAAKIRRSARTWEWPERPTSNARTSNVEWANDRRQAGARVDRFHPRSYAPVRAKRRGSQVVRSGSAKPLFAGSIPAPASPARRSFFSFRVQELAGLVPNYGRFIPKGLPTFSALLIGRQLPLLMDSDNPSPHPGSPQPFHIPLDRCRYLNNNLVAAAGVVTYIGGRVLTASGTPIKNALVEIWHADNGGNYVYSATATRNPAAEANFPGFGQFITARVAATRATRSRSRFTTATPTKFTATKRWPISRGGRCPFHSRKPGRSIATATPPPRMARSAFTWRSAL